MAAEKRQKFIHELLHQYDELHFIKDDGSLDETTNVTRITNTAVKYGLKLNNKKQTVQGFTFYPTDYFCPKNSRTMEINITKIVVQFIILLVRGLRIIILEEQ